MTPKKLDPNRPINAAKFLTTKQLGELTHYLDQFKGDIACLIIDVLMQTGCRTHEAMTIDLNMIDLERGYVFIRAAKRSIDREVPASRALCNKIRDFYDEHKLDASMQLGQILSKAESIEQQKWLLQWYWRKIRFKIWRGQVNVGLHALRHSFALYVYEQEKDVWAVKTCLGHKSINSTQRYMPMFIGERIAERLRGRFDKQ
jgi:integrase